VAVAVCLLDATVRKLWMRHYSLLTLVHGKALLAAVLPYARSMEGATHPPRYNVLHYHSVSCLKLSRSL
jgi:hypothetical protein